MIKDGTIKYQEIWNSEIPDMSDISDVIIRRTMHESDDGYKKEHATWTVYQNMMTGKASRKRKDVERYKQKNIYMVKVNFFDTTIHGFYVVYNEKFDVLIMYLGDYHPLDAVKGETRGWEQVRPVFVIERNGILYSADEKYINGGYIPNAYDMRTETILIGGQKWYIEMNLGDVGDGWVEREALELHTGSNAILKRFFGNAIPNAGKSTYFRAIDTISPWNTINRVNDSTDTISEIQETPQEEKEISAMKEYLSYELPDVDKDIFLPHFLEKTEWYGPEDRTKLCLRYDMSGVVLQKVSGDISVLRTFVVCVHLESLLEKDIETDDLEIMEVKRVYLDGFKKPVICDYLFGEWKYCNGKEMDSCIHKDSILFPWKPEDSKGTALVLFDDCIKEMLEGTENPEFAIHNNCNISYDIISFAFCPYAKSFLSSPFGNIKKAMIILTASRTSDFIFDQMLGVDRILYKTTKFGSNLLEAMECPPHMVKTLDKAIGKVLSEENFSFTKFDYCSKCFARIKDLFNEEYQYFRNMNSEQFEELVNIYMEENENVIGSLSRSMFSPIRDSIKCLISIYGPNNINTYMNYMFKEIFDIARESDENEVRVIVTYSDYMIMCAHLLDIDDDFRKPKWKLKRVEDITQCHDEVSFICNMRTNEEEMKKYAKAFDAVKDNWNDMLYSEDEFSVVAPKTPMDIADEGIYLQHCVKSYLENVIAGKTNILFVRKSNDLEKPFYTLEVKNNRIRQCHGFANCNVSATNGLQEFLERYCKEKHIKLEDTDKVLAVG